MFAIELTPEHPVDRIVELATAAERQDFDAVFASHHYNNRDQFQALSAVAGATDEVLVGPGVANPYETHPATLASRVATLAEVSGGRAVCGLGAGDRSTLANLGFDRDRPLRRVLETMDVARRLWAGERVDHDGTFRAANAGLNFDVDPIPTYVGAQGPHMTRMAAKHADGVLFNGAHPRDLEWARERVEEGLEARAEDEDAPVAGAHATGPVGPRGTGSDASDAPASLLAYASVSVAADADAAREAARLPVAFVAAGAPATVLERHDLDVDRAERVGEAISAGEFSTAADRVSDAMVEAFCVAGTPATVAERIDALLTHADGIVLASPLGPDLDAAIELLAEARDRATA